MNAYKKFGEILSICSQDEKQTKFSFCRLGHPPVVGIGVLGVKI